MPFIANTPEAALVSRSDSKSPATTCKGITSSGKPCRRPLASGHSSSSKNGRGVLAVLDSNGKGNGKGNKAAAYFCWQHQDQAELLAKDTQDGRRTNIVSLNHRSSIDTLVDRLGVLDVADDDDSQKQKKRRARRANNKSHPRRNDSWDDVEGPLMSVPDGLFDPNSSMPSRANRPNTAGNGSNHSAAAGAAATMAATAAISTVTPAKPQGSSSRFSLFCCAKPRGYDDDENEQIRPIRYHEKVPNTANQPTEKLSQQSDKTSTSSRPGTSSLAVPVPTEHRQRRTSETQVLLSFIPKSLPPQTTSLLLAELAKPLSASDEPGYIYMFWLTSEKSSAPSAGAASSLLSTESKQKRQNNDILKNYHGNNSLLLKIGRANNVQRRLNEWKRQCNYNLSLIRYYPYVPSHAQSGNGGAQETITPHKVPHVNRVERLIHIELADRRVKRDCEVCGKEHREWFEVDATREGVAKVDEIIRRWVDWAEKADART